MDDHSFTAGITFQDDRVVTVDVTGIDGEGIAYTSEQGPGRIPWAEVKAAMLATTDHMLETGGSLFTMAERLEATGDPGAGHAPEMRRFGLGLLQQVAPRVCPLGQGCGMRPGPTGDPPPG